MTLAQTLIPLIDHTSLSGHETEADIAKLCHEAKGEVGEVSVAAVCVYKGHVPQARRLLASSDVKVATVVNFPHGMGDAESVRRETREALEKGAQEIDLVTPFYEHRKANVYPVWDACLEECAARGVKTKLILETAAWRYRPCALLVLSHEALVAGFDFLKTSTGKFEVHDGLGGGADPRAVKTFIRALREIGMEKGRGIKISGGIRTLKDAAPYIELLQSHDVPLTPNRVRFGASTLLLAARQA